MKVHIHEMAAREFDEAILWYEAQSQGLGDRFKKTILHRIEMIKKNPSWFLREKEVFLYGRLPIYIESPGTGSPE
jgi:hypothetical protein